MASSKALTIILLIFLAGCYPARPQNAHYQLLENTDMATKPLAGDKVASIDYDNPDIENRWCQDQRTIVEKYLLSQKVKHGRIGEWPAWHIAPYVSIWAIESIARPDWIGWWAISGDLPTDYISSGDVEPPQHPRKAIKAIAARWLKQATAWSHGQEFEGVDIPGPHSHQELAPLLETRAKTLIDFVNNDSLWEQQ